MITGGVALSLTSGLINPEPELPFYKNGTRIVPCVFGIGVTIKGLLSLRGKKRKW